MKRKLSVVLAAAVLSTPSFASAQRAGVANPLAPSAAVAPDPKDVASPDAIIAALYDANTTMVNDKRGADRFRSLFAPDARLIPAIRVPWVVTVLWDNERPDNPMPAEYKPRPTSR